MPPLCMAHAEIALHPLTWNYDPHLEVGGEVYAENNRWAPPIYPFDALYVG